MNESIALTEAVYYILLSLCSPRRKDYAITEKGKEVLLAELARLKELVQNGEKVLEGK